MTEECSTLRVRFARDFMDLTILRILSGEALWGYRLMSLLEGKYGVKVGPSVIYPLLDSMQANGLIEREETFIGRRARKVYRPTEKGLKQLRCLQSVLPEFTV
jgi:DNA-binding PadR family transcriptional regulator